MQQRCQLLLGTVLRVKTPPSAYVRACQRRRVFAAVSSHLASQVGCENEKRGPRGRPRHGINQ